jgi:putative MATE family efflux protein
VRYSGKTGIHKLIGSRSFYREALLIMLPVAGQQLITSMFSFIDSLMVGMVSASTLSGVIVANKIFFVYSGFFWGITGAGGLLISQYFGARDKQSCQMIFTLQHLAGAFVAVVFTGLLLTAPEWLMRLFVSQEPTVNAGLSYISYVRYSYLPAGISMVSMFSLRAVGQSRVPLMVGIAAIISNVFLNWVFIFGNLGSPAMGAAGAGLATLIARVIEMLFYLIWIASGRTYFSWYFGVIRKISRQMVRMAAAKTFPLIGNEFLWTMGTNMFFWSYARLDESALPALAIVEQSMQFVYVLFGGISAAVSIMIGSRLGAGRFEEARDNSRKMLFLSACMGFGLSIIVISLSKPIPLLYNVSGQLQRLATVLIIIQALMFIPNVLYTNIFFILRAGGDIRSAFHLDATYTWLVPIPVAILLSVLINRWVDVSILFAYPFTQILLYTKLIPAFRFLRRGHWLRNLTLIDQLS